MKSVHVSYLILGAVVWAAIIAPPNISAHRVPKASAEHAEHNRSTRAMVKIKEKPIKQAEPAELPTTELGPEALQKALFDLAVKDPKGAKKILGEVDTELVEKKLPPIESPTTPNAPGTSRGEQQEDQLGAHPKAAKVGSDESNQGNGEHEGHAHEPERPDVVKEGRSPEHPEDKPNDIAKETKPGEDEDTKNKRPDTDRRESAEGVHESEKNREHASGDPEHDPKVRKEEGNAELTPSEGPHEATSEVHAEGRRESGSESRHEGEGRNEIHNRLPKTESNKIDREEYKSPHKNRRDTLSDSHKPQPQERPGSSETSSPQAPAEESAAERRAEAHHHQMVGDRPNRHASRTSTEHTPEPSGDRQDRQDHVEEHTRRTSTSLHVIPRSDHRDHSGIEKPADAALPAPTQSPVQITSTQPLPAATGNSQGTDSVATAPSIGTPAVVFGTFGSIFQGQGQEMEQMQGQIQE